VTKPFSPAEARKAKQQSIPPEVIEVVNTILARECSQSGYATMLEEDVITAILEAIPAATRSQIYKDHWLDFEEAYRAQGWSVDYDAPGYNESYKASYTFRPKRGGDRD
jgi:hypothetical protein